MARTSRSRSRTGSFTGNTWPVYNWLRLRYDVGGQSTLGVALTDREEWGRFNRVGAVDGRLLFAGAWSLVFQGGGSATRAGGATAWAPFWSATLNRAGRGFGFTAAFAISALALMGGGQGHVAVGLEWSLVAVASAYVYVSGYVHARRRGGSPSGLPASYSGSFLLVVRKGGRPKQYMNTG